MTKAASRNGLFCFNDSLALGALKAFHDQGLHIPDDIAVVGWDDIEEASYTTPTLTTIAPDKARIAQQAVAGLKVRPADRAGEPDEVTCPFELKIRLSTSG